MVFLPDFSFPETRLILWIFSLLYSFLCAGFSHGSMLIILNGVCLILIYRFATQFWEYTSQLKLKLTLDAVHNKCTEAFCQGFAKFTFIFCLLRGQNHRSVNLSRKYQMYKHFYRLFQKIRKGSKSWYTLRNKYWTTY